MFVNDQDTTLLHGVLASAVAFLKNNGIISDDASHLINNDDTVKIVSSNILKLVQDTSRVKNEMEFLEMQLRVNRRLHAAMFFGALRSNGITCAEANNYYESIAHIIPSMDWKFYLKLNNQCNWSEYFIECANQLEADILATVIKALLSSLSKDDDLMSYTWHLSLQSIIWKFFHLEDSSLVRPPEVCPFNFPFINSNTTDTSTEMVFTDNPAKSKLLHAYITILNRMIEHSKTKPITFDFAKIVFHFFKTTFKLLMTVSTTSGENVKELFRMDVLLKHCLTDKDTRAAIESAVNVQENFLLDHCYVTTSWEVCGSYLLYLMYNYFENVQAWLKLGDAPFHAISSLLPAVDQKSVMDLCPFFKYEFGPEDEHIINLILTALRYNYPCASRAVGILLMHPEVVYTKNFTDTLKKHSIKLNPHDIYPFLISAIVNADYSEYKDIYLNLFYESLSRSSESLYYDGALQLILGNHGMNEHFKLPSTDSLLVEFTRKTMTIDEAEKFLLPLFIQVPDIALKTVIEQAFIRGAEGIAIIPVLKKIPSACIYKDHNYLVNELSHYFLKKNLETYEEKNIVNLVESVMEVQVEKKILLFDKFLELCVLPTISKNIRVDLTLECLNVSLKVLISKEALTISDGSFFELIDCLTSLTNSCVLSGNGKRKELILLTLSLLKSVESLIGRMCERHSSSLQYLSTLDEVVHVYFKPFYGKELFKDVFKSYASKRATSKHNAMKWIDCCHSENLKMRFKKRFSSTMISYDDLRMVLNELLFHFTKEEWMQSANLLKEYFDHFSTEENFEDLSCRFPKSDRQLYAVIETLMSCYGFVLTVDSCDVQYLTSCFTNTVMSLLNQDCHSELLLNVFLHVCCLVDLKESNLLHLLSSLLMAIHKQISMTCEDKTQQENYLKIALWSIEVLPDSCAKTSLLQKIQ